jgi:hypothetical protein
MGPIEILYCWQALLIAVAATGITQLVKTILDVTWGARHPTSTPSMSDAKKLGEELRKRSIIVNRFILPMTPILVGALLAIVIPAQPDVLIQYVRDNGHENSWKVYMIYALWGGACGQFSSYGFDRVKTALGVGAKPPESDSDSTTNR